MDALKNTYFALRHGQSKANVAGIIVSHLEDGKKDEFALTSTGEENVLASARAAKQGKLLDETTIIVSSPFSRCKRTAEIAQAELGATEPIQFDERLRERWFGDLEKGSNKNYPTIWLEDEKDATHEISNVESVLDVQKRMFGVIQDLEQKYAGKNILLVSHGDPLQIIETKFRDKDGSTHRRLPPLDTAEIRKLN